jgi:hypothetical protein
MNMIAEDIGSGPATDHRMTAIAVQILEKAG